jgi:hypothetical protein
MDTGRITTETSEQYHGCGALSVSKMKTFRQSPALYNGRYIAKTIPDKPQTEALLLGIASSALILEGESAYRERFYTIPEGCGKKTNADKAVRGMLEIKNPGKLALDFDQDAMLWKMRDKVYAHKKSAQLLSSGVPENTFRIRGEHFHFQVRPDWFNDEGIVLTEGMPYIVDLKTIPDLPEDDPDVISRQIADYWYHGQAWSYREIVSQVMKWPDEFRPPFFFIFVAKSEPYTVQVVELDDVALAIAEREVADTLIKMRQCYKENYWPDSWETDVRKVALPPYYVRRSLETTGPNLF